MAVAAPPAPDRPGQPARPARCSMPPPPGANCGRAAPTPARAPPAPAPGTRSAASGVAARGAPPPPYPGPRGEAEKRESQDNAAMQRGHGWISRADLRAEEVTLSARRTPTSFLEGRVTHVEGVGVRKVSPLGVSMSPHASKTGSAAAELWKASEANSATAAKRTCIHREALRLRDGVGTCIVRVGVHMVVISMPRDHSRKGTTLVQGLLATVALYPTCRSLSTAPSPTTPQQRARPVRGGSALGGSGAASLVTARPDGDQAGDRPT
ncbi:MAG: hypothetical protein FJX77_10690 [Armatimonadetes bacterium]|nr:hypothetical protein [Armatimonadota bacterium]